MVRRIFFNFASTYRSAVPIGECSKTLKFTRTLSISTPHASLPLKINQVNATPEIFVSASVEGKKISRSDTAPFPGPAKLNLRLVSGYARVCRNCFSFCFFFSRCIVPHFGVGLSLANASVYLSCVMTLAVYNVTKCVEDGKIIEPVDESTDGTISYVLFVSIIVLQHSYVLPSHPKPFKCSIVPRSSKAEALIRSISGPDRT